MQQLYQFDQLMHEESGTMQSLQRDKEDLERALGGLRKRLHEGHGPPQALDAARKQQHTLERELSRVHQLLADNSKVDKVPLSSFYYFESYSLRNAEPPAILIDSASINTLPIITALFTTAA